ncbi:hypothetical protein Ocin01_06569 [Orchesella cincta]|uniref:Uncharacterized protein n=1 Tax=Orchesella cincta TaxID=48709 RepID=A0A1D2N4F5_ORCCI|nr:hypothetical protein Ocin01_06569 [Orchesella cincta]
MLLKKATILSSVLLIFGVWVTQAMETEPFFEESHKTFQLPTSSAKPQSLVETNKSNRSLNITFKDEIDQIDDAVYMERILLQMFIVICGTAGVFVLCFVCCVQCVLQAKSHRNSELPPNIRALIAFQRDEETERNSFIPMHHHPWSPGILQIQDSFDYHYDENQDKPPCYDDLSPETPCSPPPPPYSPSFELSDSNNSDLK